MSRGGKQLLGAFSQHLVMWLEKLWNSSNYEFFFKYLDMVNNKILINRKQSEFQHLSGQTDISIHIITGGICLILDALFHTNTDSHTHTYYSCGSPVADRLSNSWNQLFIPLTSDLLQSCHDHKPPETSSVPLSPFHHCRVAVAKSGAWHSLF